MHFQSNCRAEYLSIDLVTAQYFALKVDKEVNPKIWQLLKVVTLVHFCFRDRDTSATFYDLQLC